MPTTAPPLPPAAPACRFPLEGGTGGIWKGVAALLPKARQSYGQTLVGLDKEKQIAKFADGRQVGGEGRGGWGGLRRRGEGRRVCQAGGA